MISGDDENFELDPVDGYDNSIDRNIEVNKHEIAQLRAHIAQLEQDNGEMKRGGFQPSE
jgi:hypothetical protein